jgi:hypothetical protein
MNRAMLTMSATLGLWLSLTASAQAQLTAAERQKRTNDLKQIGLAYHNYFDSLKKAPAKAADLGPFVENDKRLLGLLDNKDIVFQFGVTPLEMTDGTSNTVLAYDKDVPTKGGLVLMGDVSVKSMTAEEFKKAKLATPKKK